MPTQFTYQITGTTEVVSFPSDDQDLLQRAAAIASAVGASYRVQPVPISSWAPEALPPVPYFIGAVIFHGLPSTQPELEGVWTCDAYGLRKDPKSSLRQLVQGASLSVPFDVEKWEYTDPDDVVPASEDPIGEPWPDHKLAAKRKIFHTSPAFSIAKWPLGTIDKPQQINRPDGRYTLFGWYEGGHGGPFGAAGTWKYAWEKDYSK